MEITKEQFNEYREVQNEGAYNMFSPQARELTNLTKQEWIAIIKNYNELLEKFN